MSWQQEANLVPTAIVKLRVILLDDITVDPETELPIGQSAKYAFTLVDQNGDVMKSFSGDLVPHITSPQRQALMDFMDSLRAQAEAQVL
jgi:hypothetical protein